MKSIQQKKSNIILIGMPGSGKSTIGVILAKALAMEFVDTDILIQTEEQRTLQEIIDSEGHMALRRIEENVLLEVDCENHVIATGGSAPYSDAAMRHLKQNGVSIFLHTDLPALKSRVRNYETRGLAKRPDQSFQDLFDERSILYTKYGNITIETSSLTQDQVCEEILMEFKQPSEIPFPLRLQKEFNTIKTMVKLFCKDHHQPEDQICEECSELVNYAGERLRNCPFHDNKSTCGKCSIHCYRKDMQEKIIAIMRYAGPRMAWKHPVIALQHFINSRKKSPVLPSQSGKSTVPDGSKQ
ncbi:MAG: nitrous oxide-stimulated promoter family protein [Deltaproteobacteria bacterium]|nr:nitrous oxide-stimulated promoter family protein [Deltaproteobacteria bacterium]